MTMTEPHKRYRKWHYLLAAGLFAIALPAVVYLFIAPRPPGVTEIMLVSAFDETFRPVEIVEGYGPNDRFSVSIALQNYDPDDPLSARWYYDDSLITETWLGTQDAGDGYAGFELVNNNPPWPVGTYAVEVYWRDQVLAGLSFEVSD